MAAKYFGPSLNRTNAFVGELNADERLFERFVVNSGKLSTAVAERGDDLSSAISNASTAFGAIARQNVAFSQTLRRLPPVFRQSNTTFVNLRAALDDLDPLVETAKPATKNLAPFLAELRPVISESRAGLQEPAAHRAPAGQGQRRRRAARRPARSPAARRQGLPALRRGDRRLPAEPQLRPRLHAGHLQRLRQARPGHRLLRRQRPLRARSPSPTSTSSTTAAANCSRSRRASSSKRSAPAKRSSAAARAAPPSRPPTAPTRSSNRPSPAPASTSSQCNPADAP